MRKAFSLFDLCIAVGITGAVLSALGLAGIASVRDSAREQGYQQGKIDGFFEAQSTDLVADRCIAFWFGSEREGAKTMQRYCKIQGETK
jgi:hypothetical protein